MNTLERIKLLAKQRDITIKELSIKLGIGKILYIVGIKQVLNQTNYKKLQIFLTSQPTIYLVVPKKKYYELNDKEKKI